MTYFYDKNYKELVTVVNYGVESHSAELVIDCYSSFDIRDVSTFFVEYDGRVKKFKATSWQQDRPVQVIQYINGPSAFVPQRATARVTGGLIPMTSGDELVFTCKNI